MYDKKTSFLSKTVYKIFELSARIRYRRTKIVNSEAMQEKNTIIIANHAQLNGPIMSHLFLPENYYIWANGQMFEMAEVPSYAMDDFFPYKRGWSRPFYKIASYLLAPLMPCIMENSRTVPVYHDARMASTVKRTIRLLAKGNNIVIFPEKHEKRNSIINMFRDQFVDIARLYYRRTGELIRFQPMYIAPTLNCCYMGDPICYNPNSDIESERCRISEYLAGEITKIGRSLPEHTVVPFDNISRKEYISNKETEMLKK